MALIRSNADLRLHLGGAVSTSLGVVGEEENDRILNYVPIAETKFIAKAISNEVLETLQVEYDAEEKSALFLLVQKACAFYAYAEYLPFSVADEGDNGLSADEKKAPKMWMLNERVNKAYELGADMLEAALSILFKESAVFKESESFTEIYGLLVNSGEVLGRALPPSNGSYRFFLTLWPYLADVEERELVPIVGPSTYEEFVAKRNGVEVSGMDAVFLKARRKAESLVAYAAYADALPQGLVVSITKDGALRVLSEFDGMKNRTKPDAETMSRLISSVESKRDLLRNELKMILDQNLEVFTDYATEKFAGVNTIPFMDADKYNTIFPFN